jgi:hypothetical protein
MDFVGLVTALAVLPYAVRFARTVAPLLSPAPKVRSRKPVRI